jgi:hypothetical protein
MHASSKTRLALLVAAAFGCAALTAPAGAGGFEPTKRAGGRHRGRRTRRAVPKRSRRPRRCWARSIRHRGRRHRRASQLRLREGGGAIGERWLRLEAVALPGGMTALRVDARVLWLLERLSIPRRAAAVHGTLVSFRRGPRVVKRFTVRARTRVAAVARLLDALPATRPTLMVRKCPRARGTLRLDFLGRAGAGRPLASVRMLLGGCGATEVTAGGRPGATLAQPENLAVVGRALGVRLDGTF